MNIDEISFLIPPSYRRQTPPTKQLHDVYPPLGLYCGCHRLSFICLFSSLPFILLLSLVLPFTKNKNKNKLLQFNTWYQTDSACMLQIHTEVRTVCTMLDMFVTIYSNCVFFPGIFMTMNFSIYQKRIFPIWPMTSQIFITCKWFYNCNLRELTCVK